MGNSFRHSNPTTPRDAKSSQTSVSLSEVALEMKRNEQKKKEEDKRKQSSSSPAAAAAAATTTAADGKGTHGTAGRKAESSKQNGEVRPADSTKHPSPEERKRIIQDLIKQAEQLEENGDFQNALNVRLKELAEKRKLYSDKHQETAEIMVHVGDLCNELGKLDDAVKWYRNGLAVSIELLGEDREELSVLYTRIAEVYKLLGDVEKAYLFCRKGHEIMVKTKGLDDPTTKAIKIILGKLRDDARNPEKKKALAAKAAAKS
eukprot:CAMPEP_0196666762 /NCGR_PEP_ID=MMETSP1086-20130531/64699_1 /TAXON_ID=77921 /ORGANISM="Cyanoptyche  gloeocystis , Strain SAG4.97" /LENGTH=260 /DNA_ID=CAMNT_0042003999 /DNA_START=740 /DNA_END=1522 /DNA_ORIENTATION=-